MLVKCGKFAHREPTSNIYIVVRVREEVEDVDIMYACESKDEALTEVHRLQGIADVSTEPGEQLCDYLMVETLFFPRIQEAHK